MEWTGVSYEGDHFFAYEWFSSKEGMHTFSIEDSVQKYDILKWSFTVYFCKGQRSLINCLIYVPIFT
jgi:hypothetical protein